MLRGSAVTACTTLVSTAEGCETLVVFEDLRDAREGYGCCRTARAPRGDQEGAFYFLLGVHCNDLFTDDLTNLGRWGATDLQGEADPGVHTPHLTRLSVVIQPLEL